MTETTGGDAASTTARPSDVVDMETLISLCKRRGFIFQSSEIYGGLQGAWDYGPLGVEMKRNVKDAWWRAKCSERDDMVGLDAAILMHPEVWRASGHVETFTDPMVDCRNCQSRFRADELTSDVCPNCGQRGQFTEPRMFNLMLRTFLGPVQDDAATVYLRPETAQGIFVNFENVLTTDAPQAAVRHRADRQVVPQRDHAEELHLPDARVRADGDGVLLPSRRLRAHARAVDQRPHGLVRALRHEAGPPAAASARAGRALALLAARRRMSSTYSRSAGRSSRASPIAATST